MFTYSDFGENFLKESGIFILMEDLDKALNQNPELLMLGGGNPGFIPEMQNYFYNKFQDLVLRKQEILQCIGIYNSPVGNISFRKELAVFFNELYNWNVTYENIAITHGSQNAFYILFNLFSGFKKGKLLRILFPILPEYIGYDQVPLYSEAIVSIPGKKIQVNDYQFRYEMDQDTFLKILQQYKKEIGCIAISSPTNPTGKVFNIKEISFLKEISEEYCIPIILDCAYGDPFPGIVYKNQEFIYSDYFIYIFSLSKTGLPGLRTGIVVANPKIISLIGKIQSVQSLSPSRVAPFLLKSTFANKEFYLVCKKNIKDYYLKKRNLILEYLQNELPPEWIQIHESEGAFFLWLYLPELKISSINFYKELKSRNLIVVPGIYYYPGIKELEKYDGNQSIRISFSQNEDILKKGMEILVSSIREFSNTH